MRRILAALALTGAATLVQAAPSCQVIGDSIAVGVGQFLPCALNATVGHTTAKILQVNPAVFESPVVIISAGSNDKTPNPQDYVNLRQRAQGQVVWLLTANQRDARQQIYTLANQYRDGILDIAPEVGKDGVHPTMDGYRRLAAKLRTWLGV